MLALSMMIGEGRPSYRVEINSNRGPWDLFYDGSSIAGLSYPINLTLVIGAGVTVASTSPGQDALLIRSLYSGSVVNLINRGIIRGSDVVDSNPYNATAVYQASAGVTLNIDNGSGFIYAGYIAGIPNYGWCVRYKPGSTLNWIAGATRVLGSTAQI